MPKVNKPKSTDIQEKLAQKLQTLRKQKGVSQSEIANYIGLTVGAYQNYENGRREANYETLTKFADYFNVSTDYLLGRDTTQPVEDVSKMSDNELDKKLMQFFMDLPENSKQGIRDFVLSIAHGLTEESQQQQQAPEPKPPIVQSTPQSPPQPVKPPIVQQSNPPSPSKPVEQPVLTQQPPQIESTQTKWRLTARRTDGRYESRYATPEEVEKLKLLENDPEPEF